MNVFVPYKEVIKVAQTMWADSKRYNKQILEIKQIIAAIEGAKAWRNHPVCLMYKEYEEWLTYYLYCFECYRIYKKEEGNTSNSYLIQAVLWSERADKVRPLFLENEELLDSHKRRLYSKSPHLYPQFAKYGTSEENWYVIDGQIVKYVNGKRV